MAGLSAMLFGNWRRIERGRQAESSRGVHFVNPAQKAQDFRKQCSASRQHQRDSAIASLGNSIVPPGGNRSAAE